MNIRIPRERPLHSNLGRMQVFTLLKRSDFLTSLLVILALILLVTSFAPFALLAALTASLLIVALRRDLGRKLRRMLLVFSTVLLILLTIPGTIYALSMTMTLTHTEYRTTTTTLWQDTTITPTITITRGMGSTTTIFLPTTTYVTRGKAALVYILIVKWIVDGLVAKSEQQEHDAGREVRLVAPDSLQQGAFLYWLLDESERNARHEISVRMDRTHNLAAIYATSSGLSRLGDDVKSAYVQGANGESLPLSSKDSLKIIMRSVAIGTAAVKITVPLSTTATLVLFPMGATLNALTIAVDAAKFIEIYNRDDLDADRKLAELHRIFEGIVLKIVGTVMCGVVTFTATPVLGAGCFLGLAVVGLLRDLRIDEWLSSKIKEGIEWLKKNIPSIIDWLYKKIFKAVLGSNATLLVVDPSGRKTGARLEGGSSIVFNEIPHAWYSGSDSYPQYAAIPDAQLGDYKFVVTARETGSFQLTAANIISGSKVTEQQYSGSVGRGQTQELSYNLKTDGPVNPGVILIVAILAGAICLVAVVATQRTRKAPELRAVQGAYLASSRPSGFCPICHHVAKYNSSDRKWYCSHCRRRIG